MLAAGEELAEAASQALGVDMQFEDISEYVYLYSQCLALTFGNLQICHILVLMKM
jgi:hypothetical protein